jgi:predicted aconitase with swiveling domain
VTNPNGGLVVDAGHTTATALVLTEPLSLWGGVDDYGAMVDIHYPQVGGDDMRR